MRVTNQMMVGRFLHNLNTNMDRLDSSNEKLSTGKRVLRPSDDSIAAGRILKLKTSLNETAQYIRNTRAATAWLDATDSALDDVTNVLHSAYEAAVSGANDTLDASGREALARKIDRLLEHVVQTANADHGGRHLFAGFQVGTPPFSAVGASITAVTYNGDAGNIEFEISSNSSVQANVPGQQIFDPVFGALIDLRDNLRSGDTGAISNTSMNLIQQATNNLLEWRAEVGARVDQLERTEQRLEELNVNFTKLLSENEDVDMAETIMNLKVQESVYRAALDSGARIIQPTLMDFLR